MIFGNNNQHDDPRVGCFKPFDLVGACKVELNLTKELEAKFEEEVDWKEFLELCDVPFLFPFFFAHVPCSSLAQDGL